MVCYHVQSFLNRAYQKITEGMSFEDGLRSLKTKLYYITLKVQLDTIKNMFEQTRNVNTFNSNHMICDLCENYYATHTCK